MGLSSFTKISPPLYDSDGETREDNGPHMDYDETDEEEIYDYDDYDYDDDTNEASNRIEGETRLRQVIKSCEYMDLTLLGPICNTGKKIKYYKEKTNPRPRHSIFWDGLTGHTILAVHIGKQWNCCSRASYILHSMSGIRND